MGTHLTTTKKGRVERHGQCEVCHTKVRVAINTRDVASVYCLRHKIAIGLF